MKHPKFQIYQGNDDKHYFRLTASNGQNILSSQGYASKASCKNGIESVKNNGTSADRFEVKEAANGKYYFNLLAANKQVIGKSQMYANKQTCQGGIAAVRRTAAEAGVEDTTA
ncbi:MAG: YegP family protein [Ardenticatenaceae bacterium]|nr:YegP family protein [Anaerolineales bacterium]MCB9006819.1 YegP family protein [Ardenticatenaceae bacterium]